MNISIIMATFNGAKYICEQLDSIVPFLGNGDELIISDDGSTDRTLEIVNKYLSQFPSIRLVHGPQLGVIRNFENTLHIASKDIIMFADQDDVWLPEKIPFVRNFFESNQNCQLLLHDMYLATNKEINSGVYTKRSFELRRRKHGVLNNILYNGYYGCCMCFTKDLKNEILPISSKVNAYDQWIGLITEFKRTSIYADKVLIVHRCHDSNLGKNLSIVDKIRFRIQLLLSFFDYLKNRK